MAFQPRVAPKWNIFQLEKLRRRGIAWDPKEPKFAPVFKVTVTELGNPRLSLYMNKGGTGGAISVALSPEDFYTFLEMIDAIASSHEVNSYKLTPSNHFVGGVRQEKPVITAIVTVGRDTEGYVYIAIQPRNDKVAKFPFKDDFYTGLLGNDGEKLDPKISSSFHAKGYTKLFRKLVGNFLTDKVIEPPKKEKSESSGGGFSKGSDNDGFDEDLPAAWSPDSVW